MPVNAHDQCPTNPIAIAVSLADKLDSLVGFFSVAEKVTSVKDPLGMRRNAVSILRTILENKIELSINVVVMKAADLYPSSVFCGIMDSIDSGYIEMLQQIYLGSA